MGFYYTFAILYACFVIFRLNIVLRKKIRLFRSLRSLYLELNVPISCGIA